MQPHVACPSAVAKNRCLRSFGFFAYFLRAAHSALARGALSPSRNFGVQREIQLVSAMRVSVHKSTIQFVFAIRMPLGQDYHSGKEALPLIYTMP